jgi:hypothetical protein
MVTITDAALRQNVWETIYDIINAGSYTTSVAPTITNAYISGEKSPMPQIVVNPIDIEKDSFTIGEDRTANSKTITIAVDIYTSKNKDLDVLADEVDVLMNVLIPGLCLTSYSELPGATFANEQKMRVKTLSYTFIRR